MINLLSFAAIVPAVPAFIFSGRNGKIIILILMGFGYGPILFFPEMINGDFTIGVRIILLVGSISYCRWLMHSH
jgi:hypothetical protein